MAPPGTAGNLQADYTFCSRNVRQAGLMVRPRTPISGNPMCRTRPPRPTRYVLGCLARVGVALSDIAYADTAGAPGKRAFDSPLGKIGQRRAGDRPSGCRPESARTGGFLLASLSLWLLATACSAAPAAKTHSGEIDGYGYHLFVPAAPGDGTKPALVVALHGCRQSAENFRAVSRFDDLAEQSGFSVLYPETGASLANPLGCWRWWLPENQIRGGEPAVIVSMVRRAIALSGADSDRVYVLGLSSGGAMSATLAALYPDVFAAAGTHSGMAFAGATTAACALDAMADGAVNAVSRAETAYHAQGSSHRVIPIIVIQGGRDDVVAPLNATRLIQQFAQLNDLADDGDGENQSIDAIADTSSKQIAAGGRAFEIRNFHDDGGRTVMRKIVVDGMGHAWAGGPAGEDFSDPAGPDASRLFWTFLSQWSLKALPVRERPAKACRDRFSANFFHYWWRQRMSYEEYRCDPWRWTWRRSFNGTWTEGRCP